MTTGGTIYVGGGLDATMNFEGAISCLQMFDAALNVHQMHALKNCTTAIGRNLASRPCGGDDDWVFYDGLCLKVKILDI